MLVNFNSRGGLYTIIKNAINDIRKIVCSGKIIISPSKLIDHRWSFCFQTDTQSTADGDYQYDNPDGCIEMLRIFAPDDNSDLYELHKYTYEQWVKECSDQLASDDEDRPTVWLPSASEHWVWPVPDQAYTLTRHFYGFLDDLSEDEDEEALERDYPLVVIHGASWLVAQAVGDSTREVKYKSYFEENLLGAIASDLIGQKRGTKARMKSWREDTADSEDSRLNRDFLSEDRDRLLAFHNPSSGRALGLKSHDDQTCPRSP